MPNCHVTDASIGDGGACINEELVRRAEHEELEKVRQAVGAGFYGKGRSDDAAALFEQVALSRDFVEFLTLPGYELLA